MPNDKMEGELGARLPGALGPAKRISKDRAVYPAAPEGQHAGCHSLPRRRPQLLRLGVPKIDGGRAPGNCADRPSRSMEDFRCAGENNLDDLISYMDEEGYLDMRNQPVHALAMLHLAEYYQLRELFIDAFAHCAGMNDQLFQVPEYQVRIPSAPSPCGSV